MWFSSPISIRLWADIMKLEGVVRGAYVTHFVLLTRNFLLNASRDLECVIYPGIDVFGIVFVRVPIYCCVTEEGCVHV
jgi:hypothetical protein